jgi:hypothetical protein
MKKRNLTADICAFALIFLFVYTASAKLFRRELFEIQLGRFPWIRDMATLMAWIVPSVELVVAGLLLMGRRRTMGFYAALTLLLVFTLYLALMLGSQQHLPCSCGGVVSWMTWKQHLVFNTFFIGIAIAGLVYSSPKIQFYDT